MRLLLALPFYLLLLAACSAPPDSASDIHTGVNCQDECASGYRWAVERDIADPVKCRGEGEFARGCREAVAYRR
jgi:hypothetical protein